MSRSAAQRKQDEEADLRALQGRCTPFFALRHITSLFVVPCPPLEISPLRGGGGGHFTVLLGNIYCGGLCSHLSHTRS